jgi:predicted Zn-dependent protease
MGLLLVARACFDPTEAPKLWGTGWGQKSQGKQTAEFISTHPSHETRIKQFEEWMPEAIALREQRGNKSSSSISSSRRKMVKGSHRVRTQPEVFDQVLEIRWQKRSTVFRKVNSAVSLGEACMAESDAT